MKALLALSLVLSSAAYADTLQMLEMPQPVQAHRPGTPTLCAAINFTADGRIFGTCSFWGYSTCGRYCQSPKTFYAAYWDRDGLSPTWGPVCGHLSAGLIGRQVMTYEPGFDRTNCVMNFRPTGTTVVVDGFTFQYVSARNDGSELLDLNNGASYLWTP